MAGIVAEKSRGLVTGTPDRVCGFDSRICYSEYHTIIHYRQGLVMTRSVAVDFDGVIHDYLRGWDDGTIYGEPVDGALESLHTLMRTYAVFVHTTRRPSQVANWIEDKSGHSIDCVTFPWWRRRPTFWNDRRLLLVTNMKLPAVAYIDDRGIRFQDWQQALANLASVTGPTS